MHQLNVIIGAHDIEDHRFQDIPPQYFRVSRVILHPNFRFSASHPDRYDVALIKLDSPVRFSDSVLPVCLPIEENLNFEGRKGVVTGWGKTDPALSKFLFSGTTMVIWSYFFFVYKFKVIVMEHVYCKKLMYQLLIMENVKHGIVHVVLIYVFSLK